MIYFLASLIYSAAAIISYIPIRHSIRVLVGIVLGNIGTFLWYYLIKNKTHQDIYISGLIWDVIMVGSFVVVPALFFNIKFTTNMIIGFILIISGLILIKV
jgi:drug/metabolite transporter (DMT)-like permease